MVLFFLQLFHSNIRFLLPPPPLFAQLWVAEFGNGGMKVEELNKHKGFVAPVLKLNESTSSFMCSESDSLNPAGSRNRTRPVAPPVELTLSLPRPTPSRSPLSHVSYSQETQLRISFVPERPTFPLIPEPLRLSLVLRRAETRAVMTAATLAAALRQDSGLTELKQSGEWSAC